MPNIPTPVQQGTVCIVGVKYSQEVGVNNVKEGEYVQSSCNQGVLLKEKELFIYYFCFFGMNNFFYVFYGDNDAEVCYQSNYQLDQLEQYEEAGVDCEQDYYEADNEDEEQGCVYYDDDDYEGNVFVDAYYDQNSADGVLAKVDQDYWLQVCKMIFSFCCAAVLFEGDFVLYNYVDEFEICDKVGCIETGDYDYCDNEEVNVRVDSYADYCYYNYNDYYIGDYEGFIYEEID
ncbi:MAG: hypothetical protein EZS28_033565 [Streblomastix strix]|uniref:Uncharacterized protein n=1 Tax=Streblomastix strix TaxID=222440 RepID=A0A5J4UK76_9EUKA|nr:MAG: hypothetical protein EZS28_033565 [Streblomastix strix]